MASCLIRREGVLPVTSRPVAAAVALPAGAALVIGLLLLVTRPSALLHPSTLMRSPSTAGEIPSPATCADRKVRMPFTGVAINPPITEAAQSFSHATKTRVSIIEFYSGFPRPYRGRPL